MEDVKESTRVTLIGSGVNFLLAVLKMVVGGIIGSAALVADAIHSISDLITDMIVLLGIRFAARPADECHTYGHGKYESIAAFIVGIVLVTAGFSIAWNAGFSIYEQQESYPGVGVIIVAMVSIISKEWLYRLTNKVSMNIGSSALHINAWHHRSDALSSVAVLCGGIAGLAGWGYGDQAVAMLVGVMISGVGLRAVWKILVELSEGSISDKDQQLISDAINEVPGVNNWHHLRARHVGRKVFMDVHVLVDPNITVVEGHEICSEVQKMVAQSINHPINILVHCEPDIDDSATI